MLAAGRAGRDVLINKLKNLRDFPVGVSGMRDDDVLPLYDSLMADESQKNGKLHWFCDDADTTTRELAILLTRLHAFSNDRVETWRKRMIRILHSCTKCIDGLEDAKGTSAETYYGAFSKQVRQRFWTSFENWEVQTIVDALGLDASKTKSELSLNDVPSTLVYYMLSRAASFTNPALLHIFSRPFDADKADWPMEPPPPGYILLSLHEKQTVREWATRHLDQFRKAQKNPKSSDLSKERLYPAHEIFFLVLLQRITPDLLANEALAAYLPTATEIASKFPFVSSSTDVWKSVAPVCRMLSDEVIIRVGLHRTVLVHLHDVEPHFEEVLQAMREVTKKLDKRLWEGESVEYPQVVFDSIKDNPRYTDLIIHHDASKGKAWFLLLFLEFLKSLWDLPAYGDVLAKFTAFTCEELQHERFEAARPFVMETTAQVLSATLIRAEKHDSPKHRNVTLSVIDIHFDTLVSVAFQNARQKVRGKEWESARRATRALVRAVLKSDVKTVSDAFIMMSSLSASASSESVRKLVPSTRCHLWSKVYGSVDKSDGGAVRMIVETASIPASLDRLHKRAISKPIWREYETRKTEPPKDLLEALEYGADGINKSLVSFQEGFLDCVTRFANANTAQELRDFLDKDDMVRNLTILLLSPVEDFNVAAQTLISQAFDVDGRVECFREITRTFPASTFEGLVDYLERFNAFAPQVPEARASARALVRCMSDVIEVLGTSSNALLKDRSFTTKEFAGFSLTKSIPRLWKAMTESIAVIFRHTPRWSFFFEKDAMTEWMRDALIFARDLLECQKPFEAAMSAKATEDDVFLESPKKSSQKAKRMMEDFQGVLQALQGWLRVTNMELLYQAFHLLKSLFQSFAQADVKPSKDTIEQLTKFIEANRKSGEVKRSYLSLADFAELETALADFEEKQEEEEEDEVQILSVSMKQRDSSPEIEEIAPPLSRFKKPQEAESGRVKVSKQSKLEFLTKEGKGKAPESKGESGKPRQKVTSPPTSVPVTASSSSSASSEDEDDRELSSFSNLKMKFAKERQAFNRQSLKVRHSSPESDRPTDDARKLAIRKARETEANRKEEARRLEAFEKRQRGMVISGRRKVQLIEDPIARQEREQQKERARKADEARRTALRLKPDLKPLHKTILSWNYDHDGDEPPKFDRSRLSRLPDVFYRGQDQYLKVFEPLLTLECWAQIRKSKEEPSATVNCVINNRTHNDKWLDLVVRVDDPPTPDWRLNAETDIVLLRHLQNHVSIMAKVATFKKGPAGYEITLTCCTEALASDPGLLHGSIWQMQFVLNLNTLHREFSALIGLQYCDINNLIYKPALQDPVNIGSEAIKNAMRSYQVNEPQAKAILSAMSTKGFSLIQGPPGTGKTSTICGLVGAFLSSRSSAPKPIGVPGRQPPPKEVPKKILLCAPSNAAIDEVAKRLIDGVRDSSGKLVRPKVVRVGNESVINVAVKDVSLDTLVEQRLAADGHDVSVDAGEGARIRAEMEEVKQARDMKLAELSAVQNNAQRAVALQQECDNLNTKRRQLTQRLNAARDNKKAQSRALDGFKRQYRQDILSDADVICTTLSGSGSEQLVGLEFSMVIIDEAAQAIELSSLIPLKYQSERYVLVGDPQQLPPTVLSPEATKWGYDQSLFVRMQRSRPSAVHLLSIQYRMHPEISRLPSKVFYEGRLLDGPDMDKKTAQPWHREPRFGIFKFFNAVRGREEGSTVGHSVVNREEVRIVAAIYDRLIKQFPAVNFDYRIGVVTMYKAQLIELKKAFRLRFGQEILSKVDFNTVDGFQGQEKDIIILSCVRAGTATKTIGFLSDVRRVNVGITRCRSSLYIIGHAATLERCDKTWKGIVEDARSRQSLVELNDMSYFTKNVAFTQLSNAERGLTNGTTVMPMEFDSAPPSLKNLPKGVTRKPKKVKGESLQKSNVDDKEAARKSSPLEDGELTSRKPTPPSGLPGSLPTNADESKMITSKPSTGLKRATEGDHEPRPSPNERLSVQAGSSKAPTQHQNGLPKKPTNDINEKARKQLEAYQKRKEKSNNPFIKR